MLSDLPVELLCVNLLLPILRSGIDPRSCVRSIVLQWAKIAGNLLGLDSYLFGLRVERNRGTADDEGNADRPAVEPAGAPDRPAVELAADNRNNAPLGVANDPTAAAPAPVGAPYRRPRWFALRILALLSLLLLSVVSLGWGACIVPVLLGRAVTTRLFPYALNDICAWSVGVYLVWMSVRVAYAVPMWLRDPFCSFSWRLGERSFRFRANAHVLVRALCADGSARAPAHADAAQMSAISAVGEALAVIVVVIVLPVLFGILIEQALIQPAILSRHESPAFWTNPSVAWAMGVIVVRLSGVTLEHVLAGLLQQDDQRRRRVAELVRAAWKPLLLISFSLAVPYVFTVSVLPRLGASWELVTLARRFAHLFFVSGIGAVFLLHAFVRFLRHLQNMIRDELYLVGQQLRNVDNTVAVPTPTLPVASAVR